MYGKVNSSSFLADAVRLKLQQEYLDKASLIAIKNMKHSNQIIAQEIVNTYNEREKERYEEKEKLNSIVFSTLNSLKQLKNDAKNEDRLRKLDIDFYRESLAKMHNRMKSISGKSEESLQKLSEEENSLSQGLKYLEKKINEWKEPLNPSTLKPAVQSVSKSYISNTNNTKQEVLAFQKFLQDRGGHTGGWNEEDHLLFLRMRNKSKGKGTFLSLLRQHLPDISADEMLSHEEWYHQYEILKSKQKEAIRVWKTSKCGSTKEETTGFEVPGTVVQQRKLDSREDSEKKKQMILEWKQTLQLKKELENKKEWEVKQKYLEREQKKKEKQEIKKAKVEHYKEEKLEEQHTKMVLKQLTELREMEERAAQANLLLKSFRKQDQLFVARQLSKREQRMLKEEERQKHIENLKRKMVFDTNASRLMQSTAAWRERCRRNAVLKSSSVPMSQLHLQNIPHLQVPNWRKDLV